MNSSAEFQELKDVMREMEALLEKKFQPNRFNYCQLGNSFHRLHFHAIPRYKSTREFQNIIWTDETFGDLPKFTDHKESHELIVQIRETLLKN